MRKIIKSQIDYDKINTIIIQLICLEPTTKVFIIFNKLFNNSTKKDLFYYILQFSFGLAELNI